MARARVGQVLGDEADGFAVAVEAAFEDGGLDDGVLFGGDADEFGEFEVSGTEALESRAMRRSAVRRLRAMVSPQNSRHDGATGR